MRFHKGDRLRYAGRKYKVWGYAIDRDVLYVYRWRDVVATSITITALWSAPHTGGPDGD